MLREITNMNLEDKSIEIVREYGPLVARLLMGGMFFMAGVGKIFTYSATIGYIESAGLPLAGLLAFFAIIIEVGGGLSLLLGYKIRYASDILILFTILATVFFHNDLTNQVQMTLFTKNLAIIGGLLYMMAYGAGQFSIDNKKKVKDSLFNT